MRVKNKIALITGGTRGIGAESAKLLAKEGATVIVVDVLDDEGQLLVEEIGGGAVYYHLDVSKPAEWEIVCEDIVNHFGRLDIVFNNAGVSGFEPGLGLGPQDPEHVSLEDWHYVHQVNLDGVFLGCKYGIKLMKEKGGSIINMSSRAGMVGVPVTAAYCSSKGAVRNYTKTVAIYCAQNKYRIRCNSLHPGAIYTPIWDSLLGNDQDQIEKSLSFVKRGIPLGEMGSPIDVAYSVLYLASDESKYLTGMEMVIDGGIMAGSTAAPNVTDDS